MAAADVKFILLSVLLINVVLAVCTDSGCELGELSYLV